MRDVFITGTWRKEWNKEFNLKLEAALVAKGVSCFLPQRDSNQDGSREEIFRDDIAGVDHAKLLLAIGANNAQSSNWGVEIGYAYAKKTPIIILTDAESMPDLMTSGAASEVFVPQDINNTDTYIDDLVSCIRRLS